MLPSRRILQHQERWNKAHLAQTHVVPSHSMMFVQDADGRHHKQNRIH